MSTDAAATLTLRIDTGQAKADLELLKKEYGDLLAVMRAPATGKGVEGIGADAKLAAQQIDTLTKQVATLQAKTAGASDGLANNMKIMLRSAEMTGAASIKAGEAQIKNFDRLKAAQAAVYSELLRGDEQRARAQANLRDINSAGTNAAERAKALAAERQITQEMVAQAAARELNVTGTQAAARAAELAAAKQLTQQMEAQAALRELNVTGTQAAARAAELAAAKQLTQQMEAQAALRELNVTGTQAAARAAELAAAKQLTQQMEAQAALRELNVTGTQAAARAAELAAAKQLTQQMEAQAALRELNVTGTQAAARAAALALEKQITKQLEDQAKWLALTDSQRAAATVKAAKAVYGNADQSLLPGVAGSSQALSAAQNAGSVAAAEEALAKLTSTTKQSSDHQLKWNQIANEGHAAARGLAGSLGTLWITYGSLIPLLSGAALGTAFKQTATAGSEFAYQLAFVKALGEETEGTMSRLSDAAKTLGQNSLQGPVELASGFRILAQAGLSGTDAIIAMNSVLDLAVVGEMDMAQAGTTLVGVMNAFSLSVNSASHVGDVFAKAAALSQTSVQEMTESMKTASVVGEQYEASLEDTATALTLLAKVNITGTAAGTSLRNMLKELYAPTKQAAGTFKDMGLEVANAQGKLKTFPEIIFELKDKLEGFDKISQVNILQRMFGERGAKEAIVMLAETRESWDKLNQSISNSSGFMRQVSSELEETTKGTFKQAINALQTAFVSVFDKAEGPMKDMAIRLKTMFASEEFKANVAVTVALLSNVASATLSVIGAVSTLINMLPDGAAGFALWVAGLSTLIPQVLAFGAAATAATAGLASTGAAAATAASVGFMPLVAAIGLVTAGYVLFSSKTPDVINSVNALNSALDTQVSRLRLVNSELQRKNTLDAGGGDVDVNRAQRELATLKAKSKEYSEKLEKAKNAPESFLPSQEYRDAAEARRYKPELDRKIRAAELKMAIAEGTEDQNRIEGNRASVNQQLKEKEALEKMKTGTKVYSPSNASEKAGGSGRGALKDARSILNDNLESGLKQEKIQLGRELIEVEIDLAAQTISATVATEKKNQATMASLEIERLLIEASLADAKAMGDQVQIKKFQNDLEENSLKLEKQQQQALLDTTKARTANKNAIDDLSVSTSRYIDDLQFEQIALDKTAQEVSQLRIEREQLRAVEDLQRRVDRNQVDPEVAKAERGAIDAKAAAQMQDQEFQRSYVAGWKKAHKAYVDDATNAAKQAADSYQAMSSAIESALDEFLTTGKLNFAKFAQSVILDIAKIEAKALAAKAMSSIGGGEGGFGGIVNGILGMFGGGGGGGGGFSSGDFANLAASFIDSAKGNVFSGSPSLHAYANTVQTSPKTFAFQNLHGFAKGGIFAEAGPEAVMPLKRDSSGRLGVQAEGGGSKVVNITVNVNGTNAPDVRRAAGQGAREALSALNGARRYG